ncbi:Uncharacterized protein Adt_33549 [Abeliophyllum distichum]|uniref:Uncharacterized protein n=1 Tax=Abeliophyllum distichum TaxID=126358 RepID=A0ABD1QWP8_9LAMI
MNVMDHVDDIYKRDAYLRTYTPTISIGLAKLRTQPTYSTKLHQQTGRPKKSRRKEASGQQNSTNGTPSSAANAIPSTNENLSRERLTMKCKKFGQANYNKRSCKWAPPPATNM